MVVPNCGVIIWLESEGFKPLRLCKVCSSSVSTLQTWNEVMLNVMYRPDYIRGDGVMIFWTPLVRSV